MLKEEFKLKVNYVSEEERINLCENPLNPLGGMLMSELRIRITYDDIDKLLKQWNLPADALIIKYLKEIQSSQNVFFERRQAGGFSYKKGIPDIYAIVNGLHLEIEVKQPGGQLSTMQEKFRDMCKNKHIHYVCAEDVLDVKNIIEKLLIIEN